MNKLLPLIFLQLIAGCCSAPKDPLEDIPLLGPLVVKPVKALICPAKPPPAPGDNTREQEVIGEGLVQIEADQKDILAANAKVKMQLPNSPDPKTVDAKAHSSLAQTVRLKDATKTLEIKNKASEEEKAQLRVERDKWKEEAEAGFQWMYIASIGLGMLLVAIGAGIFAFTQGTGWKAAVGSIATGLTLVVLGVTLDEYSCYIAIAGFVGIVGAMITGVIIVRKKYKEKDSEQKKGHHTERQLVRDMQMVLEYLPEETRAYVMEHMRRERDDSHKNRIKALKKMDSLGEPKTKTVTIPLKETEDVPVS